MKPRAIFGTTILASVLALGISCKTPLVEGPASVKTNQHRMQQSHPCVVKAIPGGLNSSCHILFQIHKSPLVQETSKGEVHSQILLYRVISDLIKNHAVSVVFFESVDTSEDVRKDLLSKCDKKCSDNIQSSLRRCVDDVLFDNEMRGRFYDSLNTSKRKAEDFCLAKILWYSYRLAPIPKALLVLGNPSVLFTGFERDQKKRFQKLKKLRLLWKLRKDIGPLFNPQAEIAFEKFLFSSREELTKARSKYVNKDAVMAAISHSSQNTALVIGLGHWEHIEKALRTIPFHERPTFYFVMPECQVVPDFSVSSFAIRMAAEVNSKNR